MVKSKEWPISKILQLAKMHVAKVNDLKPLYLENIQDIHHMMKYCAHRTRVRVSK
jgi:hypothetical protein